MSLVHNERTKLTANWLDRASTAAITLGVVAPLAAAVFGYPSPPVSAVNLFIGIAVVFGRARPTFSRKTPSREAPTMDAVEILAFVGAPLLLLTVGVVVYVVTGWSDRHAR
jgi:hypothetical protein